MYADSNFSEGTRCLRHISLHFPLKDPGPGFPLASCHLSDPLSSVRDLPTATLEGQTGSQQRLSRGLLGRRFVLRNKIIIISYRGGLGWDPDRS